MENFFKALSSEVMQNDSISDEMFKKYNVKRGLRNENGSGVLVGLTEISSVMGYTKYDEEIIPCEGKLYYRGFDVNDLISDGHCEKHVLFEETAYLLLAGKLPTQKELKFFRELLAQNRELPKNFVRDNLSTFRTRDIMNALARSVLTFYSNDKNPDDISLDNLLRQSVELVAKVPSVVAYAYRVYLEAYRGKSLIIHRPNIEYTTAEDFLSLIRDDGQFTDTEARVLDAALVLHADHGGGNNSTFTTRVVTSSGTDTYSAIAAAMGSLKGPLHGGANLYVMKMMDDIKQNVKDWTDKEQLRSYVLKILNKEVGDGSGKIFGFGHAVYTMSDPRAVILKQYAQQLAEEKNRRDEFALYTLMEEVVPEAFAEFKGGSKIVAPNVDFFSGFVYDCLGIPREVYTPLFAMARTAGWVSHRIEEILVQKRIMRPAYKNVTTIRNYVPIEQR
ncbi:MAG: citrate synthase [Deltaproteobacteria bacterium]|nr:citrate synthase [Deltaproteobacteria bacterium]MBN2672425.1 citrate synthase [Deltaproteobacteria bacterium]